MARYDFASDNTAPAAPGAIEALVAPNTGFTPGFDVLGGPMGEVIADSTSQWTGADRAAIAEFLMAECAIRTAGRA